MSFFPQFSTYFFRMFGSGNTLYWMDYCDPMGVRLEHFWKNPLQEALKLAISDADILRTMSNLSFLSFFTHFRNRQDVDFR